MEKNSFLLRMIKVIGTRKAWVLLMKKMLLEFIRNYYDTKDFIPLHAPIFRGNEKKYLSECIDSTFVSSVGKFVDKFEEMISKYTGAKHAVACVNGTAALHTALTLVGVGQDDEVVIQPLSFVATANAVSYCGAYPVFVDVDLDTAGMSPSSLKNFLENSCHINGGKIVNRKTGRCVKAVVPMHTFGLPCRIAQIKTICDYYGISLIEDAAESLGSFYNGKHTGAFGKAGVFSFNGNKTITTGGGGMIITDDEDFARDAKHITTTAKVPHKWEYIHDSVAFNYRLPNINAALGCAQMEDLPGILKEKRTLAKRYHEFFRNSGYSFLDEIEGTESNFWLNTLLLKNRLERDEFLEYTNSNGIMTRPAWKLLSTLKMYALCSKDALTNSNKLENIIVNLPSTPQKS